MNGTADEFDRLFETFDGAPRNCVDAWTGSTIWILNNTSTFQWVSSNVRYLTGGVAVSCIDMPPNVIAPNQKRTGLAEPWGVDNDLAWVG